MNRKSIALLLLSSRLCSCTNFTDQTEAKEIYDRWHFGLRQNWSNIHLTYKCVSEVKGKKINYYSFFYENMKSSYNLFSKLHDDRDDRFVDRFNSLCFDLVYDETSILKGYEEFFKEEKHKFSISNNEYKWYYIAKDALDDKEYTSGIWSYDLSDYDKFDDHLLIYIEKNMSLYIVEELGTKR